MKELLVKNLKKIVGLECWSIIGGKGTGTMISMKFGRKIPFTPPLRNVHLTEEERNFDGEYSFLTYFCWWRLDSKDEVMFGADDYCDDFDQYVPLLRESLIDTKITAIDVLYPGYDLSITFSNGNILRLFCWDIQPDEDGDPETHYVFFCPEGVFSVVGKGEIEFEKPD